MATTIPENIKKTSTLTYEAITDLLGKDEITQSVFDIIARTLTKAVMGAKSSGEKLFHFLYNEEGTVIARYCNVTHKWFTIDRFMAKSGRVKEMDILMKKEYNRVGKIKKDAEDLFVSITQADPSEKLEMLTKYEELKEQANPVLPTSDEIESVEGGFDTVEDIAGSLDVEVILEKTQDTE